MASQRFCLRWNNHQSNLLSVFDQLLHAETFTDVTLAVEGQYLKAHKMVLSACSPYFQVLFTNTPDDKHPILILKDITLADMKSLLDFMYRGEVSVDQERLTAFLRVAESLRIKGLTEVNDDKQPKAAKDAANSSNSSSTVETTKTGSAAGASATAAASSATPPQLHRIPPYVAQQQRKAQGMMLTNPLLGSALTQPKRKRGRPRKLSGSSNEGGDAEDFEEFEARANLVQGSPELMEVKMGADGYSDNSDDRDADDNDSDNDANTHTSSNHHHRRTSPGDAPSAKHSKDNTGSRKEHEQSASDEITPANYATYLRYGLLIPKADHRVPTAGSDKTPAQSQTSLDPAQPTPDQNQPQPMSPPKIRVNPNTQSGTSLPNALQMHPETVNNNNNNNSLSVRHQTTSAPLTPTSNAALTASVATTMASLSSSLANSIVSNYLSGQHHHHHQQHQLLALQMQQTSIPPTAAPQPPPKPVTPTPTTPAAVVVVTTPSEHALNHNNNSPQISTTDLNPSSPGAPDSTPSTPVTPSGAIRPPQRRRVRRKVNSPSDDPAEHLTEMSVRGLDLFRYAKIFEGIYQCTECLKENIQKTFKNKYSFQRHAFLYHEGSQRKVFPCPVCNKEFSRPDKMKNHMKTTHDGYVPRDAAYPLSFLMGAGGDLPLSMTPFPKLSKAKLAKMEKLESLMMGPHIGHPNLSAAELDASEALLQQQQRLLGHRLVDVDDIDDDMDLDEEDLPPGNDTVAMQSKIDDVVQRIQLAKQQGSRATTPQPVDTIKVEDSDAAAVSD